jgi:hypothetical protein
MWCGINLVGIYCRFVLAPCGLRCQKPPLIMSSRGRQHGSSGALPYDFNRSCSINLYYNTYSARHCTPMVLQPPSNSSNRDLLDQTAPANDEDPFAESGPRPDSSNNYQIEQSLQTNRSLLRPFPLSFKFTSYEDEWRKMTTARILQTQKLVQRPLTQSEVDAITELGAGMLSVVSYGTPIGFAAGLYEPIGRLQHSGFRYTSQISTRSSQACFLPRWDSSEATEQSGHGMHREYWHIPF